ncbi:MAG: response regulator [Spirulinaceae cyanobacterium]
MSDEKLRILLIDDNPNDRALALRELNREFRSLEAVEIFDGATFTSCLEQAEFDLVITDYQLRWVTGLDILHGVKKHKPQCPVVMFTGTGSEEIAVEAMKSGLNDYVIKSPKHYLRLAKVVRSVWEREKERRDKQELEKSYRRLFEGVPVGLYRLTPTGEILEANSSLTQLLGYENLQELLLNKQINSHVDRQTYNAWKTQLYSQGKLNNYEAQLRRCDDSLIWVRHSARAIKDQQGKLLYYEGALEDITAQKQAEQERTELLQKEKQAREEAELANRLKDEFLATLSHELRTPLNGMLGWLQLLKGNQLSPGDTTRAMEVIERSAYTQAQLIEDLLDISRIIRGKMQLKVMPLPLQGIINASLDTIGIAAQAKKIDLQTNLEQDVGLVSGDPDRLQQVIWNLLNNAIKFTPEGGAVSINLEQVKDYAQIQVKDTGIGIEKEFLPYIFDRFGQVKSDSKRQYGGLGLGLAIVRYLVEMHGGTIFAYSAGIGRGSTFTVQLPILETKLSKPSTGFSESKVQTQLPELKDIKILLVEDDTDSRELVALVLRNCGAQVTAVASVGKALAAFDKQRPDILISDIAMPTEDGYDLMQQLQQRQEATEPSLKAIALTAYAREEDQQRTKKAGFTLHLSKPIMPVQVVQAVAELV